MSLDDEIATAFAKGMLEEMRQASSTLDEIRRVTKRIPLDGNDIRLVRGAIEMWQKDGFEVAFGPLRVHVQTISDSERLAISKEMAYDGLVSVSAGAPFFIELLIAKTDEGRGFFGGQKRGFACFLSSGDEAYMSVGRTGNIILAVTKLSNVLRSVPR